MKFSYKSIALIACMNVLLVIHAPINAQSETHAAHQHDHEQHAGTDLGLNQGKKWHTDAALRQGMQHIHKAAMAATGAFHQAVLSQAEADKLAKLVNQQVDYLVANCKLEPQADAVLHVLIGDLLAGAGELSKQASSSDGLPRIVGALQQYPNYFDHPGWDKAAHE